MSERQVPLEALPPGLDDAEGLDGAQVRAQQARGFNDIVPATSSGWRVVLRDTARDPMLWFLLLTAGLFGLLRQFQEAVTLLVALAPLLGMDAWLHRRTTASSAGLASRLASTARVRRDGQWTQLPARELVPGDPRRGGARRVLPRRRPPGAGPRPAGRRIHPHRRVVPGGQAGTPARCAPARRRGGRPLGRRRHAAAHRHGTRARGLHRGADPLRRDRALGHRGGHAATPLQHAIGRIVAVLLGIALAVCLVLAGVRLWQGHGWIDALLSAVTLAVAALPEEFPVVYTFFLGVGVFRLARRKALVRRAVAVENIGRVTCIVSDKTGTITEARWSCLT